MPYVADSTVLMMLGIAPLVWQAILSVLLLVSVTLLIVAIFGQPGTIQLSPQREAALATGHTDRRTVFENALLRPLLWLLLAVSHRLALPRAKQWLRRRLIAAGSPNYYSPEEYLTLSLFVGLVLAAVLEAGHLVMWGGVSVLAAVVGAAAGVALTLYQLHNRAAKRVRTIAKRVPYSLDLIALAMGAGATFTEAVRTVVREETDDPFTVELRALLAETELGNARGPDLQRPRRPRPAGVAA